MLNGLTSLQIFMLQMVNPGNAAWYDMQQRITYRRYKKREQFITNSKLCREIAFVVKGSFRYYKMIDGVEVTTFFSFENNRVSAYTK